MSRNNRIARISRSSQRWNQCRVPAGTFHDLIVVYSTYANESEYDHGEPTRVFYEDYYARGVGLVRSVTRDTEGGTGRVVEQLLLEYKFPGS